MATRDLGRLATRVRAHRHEQYASRDEAATAAGVTRNTWKRVEEGLDVRELTYAKVDKALGWVTGSCILIAEGGEPFLAAQLPPLYAGRAGAVGGGRAQGRLRGGAGRDAEGADR